MGTVEFKFIKEVKAATEAVLNGSTTKSEWEFFARIVLFCNLLNIYFGIRTSKGLATTPQSVYAQTDCEELRDIYKFRNAYCHAFGSQQYNKLRSKLPSWERFDELVKEVINDHSGEIELTEIEDEVNQVNDMNIGGIKRLLDF